MKNRTINIGVVAEVAQALKELKGQMIFVGGAVVSLYADDPAADEIRPTSDIDMTVNLLNYKDWAKIQKRLFELGFNPDPLGHSICSYKYKDIPIDIMLADDSSLGTSNRWYNIGLERKTKVLAQNQEIFIFSAPVFIATKFEAFRSRGGDYRTSHDFEDIIYILDNRTTIVSEINVEQKEVNNFLKSEFNKILQSSYAEEILSSHLHPLTIDERYPIILERLKKLT